MKKTNITIDDLAVMVQKGFNEMSTRFENVDSRLGNLERGQEQIKLRLDQTAYQFDYIDLEKRVTHLEKKAKFYN